MQSGELNHYVEVQQRTKNRATDGSGDIEEAYVTVFPVWAKIVGQSVRDLVASKQDQVLITHRVIMRYADINSIDIGPNYRLLCEDRVYRIIGALPDDKSGREYVTLACESGAYQWQDNQQ